MDTFIVHSAVTHPVAIPATTADGRQVMARVEGVIVELVPAEGCDHGSITLRYTPNGSLEHESLLKLFAPGTRVTATFAAEES